MPLEQPYCTIEDVGKETKNSDSGQDTWYETIINLASRRVEELTHTDFWFHDHSATPLEVPRRRVLAGRAYLPYPMITLTGVTVFSDRTEGPTGNDVLDLDEFYCLVGERIIQAEGGTFGDYPFTLNMHVYGTFGYPLAGTNPTTTPPPTLPSGVRRATTLIAAAWSGENMKEAISLDGGRDEIMDSTIPSEAYRLLRKYTQESEVAF